VPVVAPLLEHLLGILVGTVATDSSGLITTKEILRYSGARNWAFVRRNSRPASPATADRRFLRVLRQFDVFDSTLFVLKRLSASIRTFGGSRPAEIVPAI
jgi:hypothetical protein